MKKLWTQTAREKVGTVDGLNLFFGALLGANLGTLDTLPLQEYAKLIAVLAFAVVTIRLVATSERKWYPLSGLAVYAVWLAMMVRIPSTRPEGMDNGDFMRLVTTLAIWIAAALVIEFSPTDKESSD